MPGSYTLARWLDCIGAQQRQVEKLLAIWKELVAAYI